MGEPSDTVAVGEVDVRAGALIEQGVHLADIAVPRRCDH
jgi:hypothetical protein